MERLGIARPDWAQRVGVGLLLIASVLSGQSHAAHSTATQTAKPAIWIDVPFAPQTADGCGSASIAMIMQYWDRKEAVPVTDSAKSAQIQAALFSPAAHGIYASAMERYFREHGYQAFAFHGRWSDLHHHLALGRPLIVSLKASGPHGPLHYVVVVGIDNTSKFVYLNDPAQQKMLRMSREGFESEWSPAQHWTLLAVPHPVAEPGH